MKDCNECKNHQTSISNEPCNSCIGFSHFRPKNKEENEIEETNDFPQKESLFDFGFIDND